MSSTKRHEYPDLAARRVVVGGGTGSVGEGVVRSYLRAGAQVIVPTRTRQRLTEFDDVLGDEGRTDRFVALVADYTTLAGAAALADRVEAEYGPVTDVVSSIGGWWAGGPLWETSESDWDEFFTGYATAHLAMARAFVPRLPEYGSYQVIIGGSAIFPVQGSGIVSMQQAALLMMAKVLQSESGEARRVFAHVLGVVNTRSRGAQQARWIDAEDAGTIATVISADASVASREVRLLSKDDFRSTLAELQGPRRDSTPAAR